MKTFYQTIRRYLNLHEYQSVKILRKYDIPIPAGKIASSLQEVQHAVQQIGTPCVIKAQALTGGRGKGRFTSGLQGGVHVCNTPQQATELSQQMIGSRIITKQTGSEGLPVNQLFIVEKVEMKKEAYLALLMDRKHQGPVFVASSEGGMDIEEVAAKTPEKIHKLPVDISTGPTYSQLWDLCQKFQFSPVGTQQAFDISWKLYTAFLQQDATQIEINPLAETTQGVMVCDAKLNFDENAEFRQRELFKMEDMSQKKPSEVQAKEWSISYVEMDGQIGCMVNGAGLAMSTMDIIKLYGGSPANFLDVGGSANEEQITAAIKMILQNKGVKSIFVNIFGGIMKCDLIAKGIIRAFKQEGINIPMVVRLKGTNVEEAAKLINSSGLSVVFNDDFEEAAKIAVKLASS